MDEIPSNAELRRIMLYLQLNGRALFAVLASSGMRIGETLKLHVEDLDLSQSPAKVKIKGAYTKTGNWRYAFISGEAKDLVEEWLHHRSEYIRTSAKRSWRHKKDPQDKRLFPWEETSAYEMWYGALQKAGLLERDPSSKHVTMHPHVLRKFFRTRMGAVIPVDVVEALMGHEGYLTEVYRRYAVGDLAEFYRKGEHALKIFAGGEDLSKLKKELAEKDMQLQGLIAQLARKDMELDARLSDLAARIEISSLKSNQKKK